MPRQRSFKLTNVDTPHRWRHAETARHASLLCRTITEAHRQTPNSAAARRRAADAREPSPHHRQQPRPGGVPARARMELLVANRGSGGMVTALMAGVALRPGHLGRLCHDRGRPTCRRAAPTATCCRSPRTSSTSASSPCPRPSTSGTTTSSATRSSGSSSTSCGTRPARPTSAAPSTRPGKAATSPSTKRSPTPSSRRPEPSREPPYVLLQDYHLYLAPAIDPRGMPEATILHFTHIPWPGPRYWGLLPEFMRRRIHEDMLSRRTSSASKRSATSRNFLHSCEAIFPGVDIDYGRRQLTYSGRTTRVRALPDIRRRRRAAGVSPTQRKWRTTRSDSSHSRNKQTIVRVDRSEPSKNIIRGLRAFELLLERHPELRRQRQLAPVPRPLAQRARRLSDVHGRDLRARRLDQRPLRRHRMAARARLLREQLRLRRSPACTTTTS